MTFSIAGRCERTGMFGIAITTSSIAVGGRCAYARARVGAVLTQHRTDPRLGPLGLDILAAGSSAAETVAALVASTPHSAWRQLAVIDRQGKTAHFSGSKITSIHGAASGSNCIAVGNVLRAGQVPATMVEGFEADRSQPLPARLLAALAAGNAAGGEIKSLVSAALLVVHDQCFPYVDLRVDRAVDPIKTLEALWDDYALVADNYVQRALDPDRAI
jgi:uncharacterized Ntn-hydrolase superfamily protein